MLTCRLSSSSANRGSLLPVLVLPVAGVDQGLGLSPSALHRLHLHLVGRTGFQSRELIAVGSRTFDCEARICRIRVFGHRV